MSVSDSVIINGHEFTVTCSGDFLDGVTVAPDANLDSPDFLGSLRAAIEYQRALKPVATVGESKWWITDPQGLRNTPDKYLYQTQGAIRAAMAQEYWPVNKDQYTEYLEIVNAEIEKRERPRPPKKQPKLSMARPGYVYLIQSPTGAYKIGRTIDPDDRMKTFSVKLPFEVEYVCLIAATDMFALEMELHGMFSGKRVNGEWFALAPEDVEYIKGLAS